MATVPPEGLCQWKIPVTSSIIKPETFRLVAQCTNQLRHSVPHNFMKLLDNSYQAGCNRFGSKSYNWQAVKVLSVTLRPSQWTSVCIIYILQISEQGRYLVEQNTIGILKHLLLPCMYNHHIWITKDPRSPSKKGWGSSQFRQSASCSTYSDSRRQWRSSNLSARASAISWNWR